MKFQGYHKIESLPLIRGDQILLQSETKVITTHPDKSPFYYTKNIKVVVVDHLTSGINGENGEPIQNPLVVWKEGEYDHAADINMFIR